MEKAETERAPSQSPTRRGRTSISDSISSGLNRFLSKDDPNSSNISTVTEGEEFYVAVPITDRSVSRGRDAGFTSSGRGGAGNIRRTSASADASDSIISNPKEDAADEVSSPRGREIEVSPKVCLPARCHRCMDCTDPPARFIRFSLLVAAVQATSVPNPATVAPSPNPLPLLSKAPSMSVNVKSWKSIASRNKNKPVSL
ncbi:hypothetical protein SISSUDRAFT_125479 [Sistotremastrum suecicum HHB10207 ss-3]|uniref:Uncharacterized protein n=1 Tax=Sistotremastrum suecicum HHB10207 ss-3 TaxID=1314776 RepID=A0A166AZ62_9AGAM|nr:hypothetical protein SISSUDRAFT_125479 [Sistotremastrum suecicum HHB10207 ss-3]